MLDNLIRTHLRRRSSDPFVGVDSRGTCRQLFENRLGFIGVGVALGVQAGNYAAWILHRWVGARLISIDPWAAREAEAGSKSPARRRDVKTHYLERRIPPGWRRLAIAARSGA